jgi:putative toxin-antitoxin system antitoxin component (TIGR02293 family)
MLIADRVTDVMGGPDIHSLAALNEAVTEGLPKSALRNTARHLYGNSPEQMRLIYRVVPEATFKRRKDRLNEVESERTERLARTIATAEYVLNDKELAREFLLSPHVLLNGKTPIETSLSELGARQVEQLLYGVFYGLPV